MFSLGEKTTAIYFALPVIAQVITSITILILSHILIRKSDSKHSKDSEWELLKDM